MNNPERYHPSHRGQTDHEPQHRMSADRRTFLRISAIALTLAAVGAGAIVTERALHPSSPETQTESFIQSSGDSLIAMHEVDAASGGWKFKSAIQSPHYQTDRDVGAASVGMGFLALANEYPDQSKWLDAATKTADWLTAVSQDDGNGGRYWSDYVDNGTVSSDAYTSFDDGAIGIGDFYWQLYEKSHNPAHKQMALASVTWTLAQAETVGSGTNVMYRWKWDAKDSSSDRYMGMGMGQAGIIDSLADFYARIQDSDPTTAARIKSYIDGGARYMQSTINAQESATTDRSVPETDNLSGDGGTALNSGYLSGAAGTAYMYLKLYRTFGDQQYLNNAKSLFDWLDTTTNDGGPRVSSNSGTTWKITVDSQGGDDNRYATGFEEGNAGIGWTYLQAYTVTGDKEYLASAKSAADWLINVAHKDGTSLSWAEDENSTTKIYHANLNNGAAGIGSFLHDVAVATGESKYDTAARGALNWLTSTAKTDTNGVYWNDNDGENDYSKDPSWHWGTAGIVNAVIRINGGAQDIPGEQPAL